MTTKVAGFDAKGRKIWEREAREYDQSISHKVFGISLGDVVKAVPIIFLCASYYVADVNFKRDQLAINNKMQASFDKQAVSIENMNKTLINLNIYLSATTGKQFQDGLPR